MEAFLYMISRNILTYTLFRGTRTALKYSFEKMTDNLDVLPIWKCKRCYRIWQGESDEIDRCPRCNGELILNSDPQNKYGELNDTNRY